jgi:hypothetical protein
VTPLVSVVVPTHDRPVLVRGAVASILAQRDVALDVIVVDDASAETVCIDDPRVRVVRRDTAGGPSVARNAGIDAATGEWIAFCDDDDVWAPDKLSAQLAAMGDAAWSCTGSVMVDGALRVVDHARAPRSGAVLDALLDANVVPGGGSSVVVNASLVRDVGMFEPARWHSEDWDLWIRLAQRSPIAAVDRPLVAYRIWSGGASTGTDPMHRSWDELMARYGHLRAQGRSAPSRDRHERWLAKQELRAGRRVAAARRYLAASRHGGGVADVVRAAGAVVAPERMDRVGNERAAAAVPDAWLSEASSWLLAGVR